MSKPTKFINAKRRGFLQGSVVAGGAVATGAATAASNLTDIPVETVKVKSSAGYRVTDKVKTYYKKARF